MNHGPSRSMIAVNSLRILILYTSHPLRRVTLTLSGGRRYEDPVGQSMDHPTSTAFGPPLKRVVGREPYRPSTTSMPESTKPRWARGNRPVLSVNSALSKVTTWETLATESFGSPVRWAESTTLPGALAHLVLLVSGTQTTVPIRLRLSASP
jgi:hypothetical protein